MSYTLDKQLAAQLEKLLPEFEKFPEYITGDALSWRARANTLYALINTILPAVPGVVKQALMLPYEDTALRASWYTSEEHPASRGAVLYVHGGGGVAGNIDLYDKIVAAYVKQSGISFLSLEYGLSPETAGHIQSEQVISALTWLQENSENFGIDPARIVLMGDSGGAGIVASATLIARERGFSTAGLVLVYPMLDNRISEASEALAPFLTITTADLQLLWPARIPEDMSNVPMQHISAAHTEDVSGLPPVYIDVGELDLFCAESLDWASRLVKAGVPTEFHLFPAVNHGFELLAPDSDIARQALALRCKAIQRMVTQGD